MKNDDIMYRNTLKEYASSWRMKRSGDDIWIITGKHGQIQPYSVDGTTACAVVLARTPRKLYAILREIKALQLVGCAIITQGDTEAALTFNLSPEALETLARPLGLRKRKHYPGRELAGAALAARNASMQREEPL